MGVTLLGKIKIHEIAKKLNTSSKEIIEVANRLNINAKSHLSGIEEEEAKKIEIEITRKKSKIVYFLRNYAEPWRIFQEHSEGIRTRCKTEL